tara:strand:- start:365 stop:2575 length:2211 start_codon:yes stop_codon:yes gene_type:complete
MFESSLNKTLLKYLASCFGLIQFADILINRSLAPEASINFLLVASIIGFIVITIKYNLDSKSKDNSPKAKINVKSSALIFIIFLVSISNIFFIGSAAEIKKLNKDVIPKINKLVEDENYFDAFFAVDDTSLLAEHFPGLLNKFSTMRNISSKPKGAKVYLSKNTLKPSREIYIGETPIVDLRLPIGAVKLKFSKEGFQDRTILTKFRWTAPFIPPNLNKLSSAPVVKIDSLTKTLQIAGIIENKSKYIPAYEIDENEITNRDYNIFLKSPAYSNPVFWKDLIKKYKLKEFSFRTVSKFIDLTGQKGPSTWSVGKYGEGKGNFPVLGISWFEALAFCEFNNKTLPNIYQWDNAAGMASSNEIIPLSNILKKDPIDISSPTAVGVYGLKNMAGNAREWIFNSSGSKRKFLLGGGFSDEIYLFNWVQSADPLDRSDLNGCRCAKSTNNDIAIGYEDIQTSTKDISKLIPVDDKTYQLYKSQYEYDKFNLNAKLLESKINQTGQRVERVELDSFNNQKMQALLYLPKDIKGPYKAILFYPGSGAISTRSSQRAMNYLHKNRSFLVESGYALILPIFTSTFERGDGLLNSVPNESINYRDHVITWGRELQITVDYLESRNDIDSENIAYMGWSWGGRIGSIMVAIEDRFKTALLIVGGMRVQNKKPEVDPLNFLPRIKIPTLMLNGRYDHFFPVETSQIPMYNFLGTQEKDKKHIIYNTGHSIPFNELAKESLSWLDKYLR